MAGTNGQLNYLISHQACLEGASKKSGRDQSLGISIPRGMNNSFYFPRLAFRPGGRDGNITGSRQGLEAPRMGSFTPWAKPHHQRAGRLPSLYPIPDYCGPSKPWHGQESDLSKIRLSFQPGSVRCWALGCFIGTLLKLAVVGRLLLEAFRYRSCNFLALWPREAPSSLWALTIPFCKMGRVMPISGYHGRNSSATKAMKILQKL